MHRYKINVEYKGTDYVGWQRQDNGMSIQESLEKAIKQLTSEKVDVFGAGRTDSGVHALNQVAHFDLKKSIELDSIRDGLNQYLRPQPIAIIKVEEVSSDFHARFSEEESNYLQVDSASLTNYSLGCKGGGVQRDNALCRNYERLLNSRELDIFKF